MYLLFFQIFGGLRLFKRLRLKFFANLYKATFIWEAMFIRDLRVLLEVQLKINDDNYKNNSITGFEDGSTQTTRRLRIVYCSETQQVNFHNHFLDPWPQCVFWKMIFKSLEAGIIVIFSLLLKMGAKNSAGRGKLFLKNQLLQSILLKMQNISWSFTYTHDLICSA